MFPFRLRVGLQRKSDSLGVCHRAMEPDPVEEDEAATQRLIRDRTNLARLLGPLFDINHDDAEIKCAIRCPGTGSVVQCRTSEETR